VHARLRLDACWLPHHEHMLLHAHVRALARHLFTEKRLSCALRLDLFVFNIGCAPGEHDWLRASVNHPPPFFPVYYCCNSARGSWRTGYPRRADDIFSNRANRGHLRTTLRRYYARGAAEASALQPSPNQNAQNTSIHESHGSPRCLWTPPVFSLHMIVDSSSGSPSNALEMAPQIERNVVWEILSLPCRLCINLLFICFGHLSGRKNYIISRTSHRRSVLFCLFAEISKANIYI